MEVSISVGSTKAEREAYDRIANLKDKKRAVQKEMQEYLHEGGKTNTEKYASYKERIRRLARRLQDAQMKLRDV